MDELTQSAKELLAIHILKEFGCFDEAIRMAKASPYTQDLKGLPSKSVDYLKLQMRQALRTIDGRDPTDK